jgi:HlyD family secretion protein
LALALAGSYWQTSRTSGYGPAFVSGNGRIEATEIDVATKYAGRIKDITVNEGDFVQAGQPLVYMQIDVLQAQRDEALAQLEQARYAVASAQAQVAARESDHAASLASVTQRETELALSRQRLERSERLAPQGATPRQTLDEDRAAVRGAQAVLRAAHAQVAAADAAIQAARAQVVGAESAVKAAQATVARIQADIDDSVLVSPRAGRVQFRVAQPGEVVSAGGKIVNVVDLTDVYMTFFLPETVAGRVELGAPARIILDAAPNYVVPARISFVASTAQFTPKTVETATERQKLMFRVKAQLDPALLRKHLTQVKTGLPGVAWVRIDDKQPWPGPLQERVPD